MGRIWDNTRRIFETASTADATAGERMVIAVTVDGGIRIVCDSDWAPQSIVREYGANESYVVSRRRGLVRVEGRGSGQTCILQSESQAAVARRLLSPRIA